MDSAMTALKLLPPGLRSAVESDIYSAEELRLRSGKEIGIVKNGIEESRGKKVSPEDIAYVLERASGASLHSVEDEIRNGFIGIEGGIRLGICGRAVMKSAKLSGLREISSLNIRIPHEITGCGKEIYERIYREGLCDVLIVSPPGTGKTSLLREYIRRLTLSGVRVSVADERGEICGAFHGQAQFSFGSTVDIITGAPKSEAAAMMIRAMNPQLLAVDEIAAYEDVQAIAEAAYCGVHILAACHGASVSDIRTRPVFAELTALGIFRYAVLIGLNGTERRYSLEEL